MLAAALVLLAAVWWIGTFVTVHGEPPALWAFAKGVRGHAVWVAWDFTNMGYAYVLAPLYAICLGVAAFSKRWRITALYIFAVALLCWGAADRAQHLFARPRRADWLIRHEHAFSYPSSHATISTGFYFLWGLALLRSELPRWARYLGFTLLTLLTLGIIWSRLALAAHYPTDVIGGVCLGLAVALIVGAILRAFGIRPLAPGAARTPAASK
jgi:membrane-associated phospholipid phosphatase